MLEGDQKEEAASAGPAGLSADEEATLKHPLQWKGSLKGNIQALLQAVTAASQGDFCMIDCSQLNSVDYPAAVALLEWLMEPQNAQLASTRGAHCPWRTTTALPKASANR